VPEVRRDPGGRSAAVASETVRIVARAPTPAHGPRSPARTRCILETALGSAPEHKWITVAHRGEPERWAAAIDALRDALRG